MRTQSIIMAGSAALLMAGAAMAATTQLGPNRYQVDAGVAFEMSNAGASSFLFSWTDSSGTFTDIEDPTLVLSTGETYTFQRTTGSHPFVICDDSLPVSGSDGSFQRDTTDGAVIDAATLQPIADFTADPAPTADMISWTPAAGGEGEYYYSCRIVFHTGMVGNIEVAPAPADCPQDLTGDDTINADDLFDLLGAWGACPGCPQDLTGDDDVNADDLFRLLGAWGDCP